MQTNRYNFYKFIHKGIRRELCELMRIGGTIDFSDVATAARYIDRLRASIKLMNAHAEHEDHHIEPLLEAVAPQLARRIAATHRVFEAQEHEVLALCDYALGDADKGYALYLALTRYAATQLGHMAEEETEAIEALWTGYTDEQIIAAEQAIIADCSPDENAAFAGWVLAGINGTEREVLLAALRHGAPPEFLAWLDEMVRAADEAELAGV